MTDPVQAQWSNKIASLLSQKIGEGIGLIEDSDHLLSGDVIRLLREQGWGITNVSSPLELRQAYEQDVRLPHIDVAKRLYVLFFPVSKVPYDIARNGVFVYPKVKDLLPTLSEKVLRQLPPAWLAVVDHNSASPPAARKMMGEQETTAFLLETCLGLSFPSVSSPASALSLLADLVLHNLELPPVLVGYIVNRVGAAWPGDFATLVGAPDRAREFFQQVWQAYLGTFVDSGKALADGGSASIAISTDILTKDRGLQSQISALLAENIIRPPTVQPSRPVPDWLRPGVHFYFDRQSFLNKWLAQISEQIPGEAATPNDWSGFAWKWADWRQTFFQDSGNRSSLHGQIRETQIRIENGFMNWLEQRYTDLLSQPYLPTPTMVHHALHYIAARFLPSEKHPLAIVVVDGMAIEDWLVIRQHLANEYLNWQIQEQSLFALVPTITPISRQALLSGQLPRNFSGDWLSTTTEETAWRVFWESRGLHPGSIAYQRGIGNPGEQGESLEASVETILNQPHKAVTVMIVNTIDELMHNNILGTDAFLQQIAIWGKQGYLYKLIGRLLEQHTSVIITADHGHLEGQGIGDIALKETAVERSLRARIFSSRAFEMTGRDPNTILQWRTAGLPDNASVFIPAGIGLFAKPGITAISHGGAALEEVIIPFITITRMSA